LLFVYQIFRGLKSALSNISGLFVAANTIIVSDVSNPSISTNN